MIFKDLETDKKHKIVISAIELDFVTPDGKPLARAEYVMKLSNGETRKGTTDENGHVRELNIPPGIEGEVELVDYGYMAKVKS
jgi:hypothetical protein